MLALRFAPCGASYAKVRRAPFIVDIGMGMEAYTQLRQQDNQDMGVVRTPSWERGPYLKTVPRQVIFLLVITQCPHVHQVTRMLGTAFSVLGWARCPTGRDKRPPQRSVGIIRPVRAGCGRCPSRSRGGLFGPKVPASGG